MPTLIMCSFGWGLWKNPYA